MPAGGMEGGGAADAEVAQMTQSLCPFTVGLGAQEFLSWAGGFKLENDSFFLCFDQQRGKYFTEQRGG